MQLAPVTQPLPLVAACAQVFLLYGFEREVAPAVKRAEWEKRPFGAHMDVAKMVALQVRPRGLQLATGS